MWVVSVVDSHCRVLYTYLYENVERAYSEADSLVAAILSRLSTRFERVWHLEDGDDEVFYVDMGVDPYVRVNICEAMVGEVPTSPLYLL